MKFSLSDAVTPQLSGWPPGTQARLIPTELALLVATLAGITGLASGGMSIVLQAMGTKLAEMAVAVPVIALIVMIILGSVFGSF